MRILLPFFLILSLFFSLPACVNDDKSGRRFRGDRTKGDKTEPRENQAAVDPLAEGDDQGPRVVALTQEDVETLLEEADSSNPQTFKFPIDLNTEHSLISLNSSEDYKISVSAEPGDLALNLLASFSGTLSVKALALKKLYVLSLPVPSTNQTLYIELNKKGTFLLVRDEQSIQRGQKIAEVKGPFVFYIKEGNQNVLICLSVNNSSHVRKVDIVESPECSSN